MKGTDHYVTRPDGRVYYCKVGRGEPLVLLHPVGYAGWGWEKVIDGLAEHFTCYNIDLPGFGHSDIPSRKYEVADLVKAILDVMDSAGIKQSSIVGSHTGALLALVIAANHPDRVKRLVADGLPYWNKERGRWYWDNSIKLRLTDVTSYDQPVYPLSTWEEARAEAPGQDRETWEKMEEVKRKSRYWITLCYQSIINFDVEALGPKIKAPTLVMYGDGERIRFGEQRAREDLKGAVVHIVPNSPGQVNRERPQEFLRLALPFLRGRG